MSGLSSGPKVPHNATMKRVLNILTLNISAVDLEGRWGWDFSICLGPCSKIQLFSSSSEVFFSKNHHVKIPHHSDQIVATGCPVPRKPIAAEWRPVGLMARTSEKPIMLSGFFENWIEYDWIRRFLSGGLKDTASKCTRHFDSSRILCNSMYNSASECWACCNVGTHTSHWGLSAACHTRLQTGLAARHPDPHWSAHLNACSWKGIRIVRAPSLRTQTGEERWRQTSSLTKTCDFAIWDIDWYRVISGHLSTYRGCKYP